MFDKESCTFNYLIIDDENKETVLIDPVISHINDFTQELELLNCDLKCTLETHVHTDHITASGQLRDRLSIKTGVSKLCGAPSADLQLNNGDIVILAVNK